MRESNNSADAESEFKTKPDVNSHHDRGGDNGHNASEAQIFANLWTYGFDPADLKLPFAELLRQSFFDLFAERTDFHRTFVEPHQVLAGSRLTKILNDGVAQFDFVHRLTDLRDGDLLRELELHHGAARKIHTQVGPLHQQQDENTKVDRRRENDGDLTIAGKRYIRSRFDKLHSFLYTLMRSSL